MIPIKKRKLILLSWIFCVLGFSCFVTGCHQNNDNSTSSTTEVETTTNDSSHEQSDLSSLANDKGAYPRDIKLWEEKELDSRLQSLLGNDYANFKKFWQVETPIEIEDKVFSTTGCEQHNCAANMYVLQIDFKTNNINVYHFGGDGIKSYLEKGKITLPPGLAKEFATINQNNS